MPQLTPTSALVLSKWKMPLNGPTSHEPASWNQLTTSFDVLAPSSTSTMAMTMIPTTTAAAVRMMFARSNMPAVVPRSAGSHEGVDASFGALDGHDPVALPGPFDRLARGHLQRAADDRARLARVDDVVDHRVA